MPEHVRWQVMVSRLHTSVITMTQPATKLEWNQTWTSCLVTAIHSRGPIQSCYVIQQVIGHSPFLLMSNHSQFPCNNKTYKIKLLLMQGSRVFSSYVSQLSYYLSLLNTESHSKLLLYLESRLISIENIPKHILN